MKLNSKNKFHLENDCLLTRKTKHGVEILTISNPDISRDFIFSCVGLPIMMNSILKHLNFNIPSLHDLVYEEETLIQTVDKD
jgi:hypothetical protein